MSTAPSHKALMNTPQTYALKVIYPSQSIPIKKAQPHAPTEPKSLNWNYRFSGSPELVPLHVYDDGKFTYFELSMTAPVPAIFAVDNKDGKETTVNSRREGKYLVVHRTAPQFTLRHAQSVTSVFNTPEINRIKHNQRPLS